MSESYGFFNAQLVDSEPDRVYEASDFAQYYAALISTGVFANPATNLQVTPGSDLSVTLKTGRAFIKGYWYLLDEDVSIPLQAAPASGTRYDAVVIELNLASRHVVYKLITGLGTGTKPTASTLTRTANVYQICVGLIRVTSGMTSLTASNIYDTRPDSDYCGWVAGLVDQIDTTGLFAQYDAAFLEWFEGVEDIIDDVTAYNLQTQINAITAAMEDGLPNVREINNGVNLRFWVGTTVQYEALVDQGQVLNNVLYIKTDDDSASQIRTAIRELQDGKAPKNHASMYSTYGAATSSEYGHVKLVTNLTTSLSYPDGWAIRGDLAYTIGRRLTTLENATEDSGWKNATYNTSGGWSKNTQQLRYRKIGKQVFIQGRAQAASSHPTSPTVTTLPSGYRPNQVTDLGYAIQSSTTSPPKRVYIDPAGALQFNFTPFDLTSLSGEYSFNFSFFTD